MPSEINPEQCPFGNKCDHLGVDCTATFATCCPYAKQMMMRVSECRICGEKLANAPRGAHRKYCDSCGERRRLLRKRYGQTVYLPDDTAERLWLLRDLAGEEKTSHTIKRLIDDAFDAADEGR